MQGVRGRCGLEKGKKYTSETQKKEGKNSVSNETLKMEGTRIKEAFSGRFVCIVRVKVSSGGIFRN